MENIKNKVRLELEKNSFPDLNLLFSKEVLDISVDLLRELLIEEKQKFDELLKVKDSEISFETFDEFSELDYFWSLLSHYKWVNSDEQIRDIIEAFRPEFQDFSNEVSYNKRYYDMLCYCEKKSSLDEEQKRVMHLSIKSYKDRWINLEKIKQERLKELNKILSKLSDTFWNNVVDDEKLFEYIIEDFEIIKDLPEDVLNSAKKTAEEKEKKGYLFTAEPSWYIWIMKYCSSSKVRSDFEKARNSFASSGKFDNRWVVLDILKFREEKAQILWYKNHAELSLNNKMADSPEQVFSLISEIQLKANKKAKLEIEVLKKYFDLNHINTYDFAFYSRIYKEKEYKINDKELKTYFKYEEVLKYLHNFVKDFYWLELKEIKVPSYSNEVKTYEVYKAWVLISYYLLDPFYRETKRWWAWADNLREKFNDKIPLVINVCNFQKSEVILLSMLDVETIFHEFWHAIHEMLSESDHSELSWFGVEWDFVELPSQILENWVTERDSLKNLAKHFETKKPISKELLDNLDKLKTYMSWNFTSRQSEFALMDMSLYSSKVPKDIEELDKKVLDLVNSNLLWERWEDYKMYTSFGHIFGWWYSAGYFSYMWAEIIEADIFAEIKREGMFKREVWERFLNTILAQWTKKPAKELFFDFMWREVNPRAFYQRKGL